MRVTSGTAGNGIELGTRQGGEMVRKSYNKTDAVEGVATLNDGRLHKTVK